MLRASFLSKLHPFPFPEEQLLRLERFGRSLYRRAFGESLPGACELLFNGEWTPNCQPSVLDIAGRLTQVGSAPFFKG